MSAFEIFRSKYIIRRFGEEQIIAGYAYTDFEDIVVSLNVQPLSNDDLQALPEGERKVRRIKAYGDFIFTTADQNTGRRGDWLFYNGHWYECKSSLSWSHTILKHCKSEFVEIADDENPPQEGM